MRLHRLTACMLMLLATAAAQGFDFKSVGQAPAILYDAPSHNSRKLYIAPRAMPLEVVLTYAEWAKVRDAQGDMAWTELSALSARRSVVVQAGATTLHAEPNDRAPQLMTAARGVLLELVDPNPSAAWVRVRHRDGITGFVKTADIWGI
jgi:SH3-like domain-containing protein